jgi:hypothetical protein
VLVAVAAGLSRRARRKALCLTAVLLGVTLLLGLPTLV